MSIQRWRIDTSGSEYVTYADYVAAVAEAEKRGYLHGLSAAREAVVEVHRKWGYPQQLIDSNVIIAAIDALRLDNSRQHLNKMVTDKLDLYDRQDVYFNQHGQGENP
jgi:hypothetical protein